MASNETAFFREILAFATAGHMASVVRLAHQRRDWLGARAPVAAPKQPYGRTPLYRDLRGEVMLAGWQAGNRCAPHDHGKARGIVIVVAGSFTETRYRMVRNALLATGTTHGASGAAMPVTNNLIHDMRCDESGATLHVYLPAIETMRVYDVSTRSTLLVGDAAGAWIPRDREHVIATEAWPLGSESLHN